MGFSAVMDKVALSGVFGVSHARFVTITRTFGQLFYNLYVIIGYSVGTKIADG